ncbi:hypothetical protein FQN54_000406 [Arachnomyces sp. PD_36]|nr:hypothetical protein FQN54_000406 [Arachnomyces sp. PD_36]
METIPQEIFLSILDYVGAFPDELLPYVTVSRRWQYTIERYNFQSLRIENTELSTFAELFRPSQIHRKALVKVIDLTVALPAPREIGSHQLEEANNQAFSAAVHKLFQVLETFNEDREVKKGSGLDLVLKGIYSPSNESRWRTPSGDPLREGINAFGGAFIHLLDHEKLPILKCVSRFYCSRATWSHKIYPASTMLAACKLKDLKLCWIHYFNHRECIGNETLKTMRHDFARAVSSYIYPLQELRIEFESTSPLDEATTPPNLISFPNLVDPLNLALHELVQKSSVYGVSFCAQHVVAPELFWPYDDVHQLPTPTPFWPNVKRVAMYCSATTPGGDWYFMADPSTASRTKSRGNRAENNRSTGQCCCGKGSGVLHYSGDCVNGYRSVPDPEKMNPLLIAMARAIRYAPSLEEIHLKFSQTLTSKYFNESIARKFDITYFASGFNRPYAAPPFEKNRLICDVQNWRPDEEVERYWRDALGPNGAIVYR